MCPERIAGRSETLRRVENREGRFDWRRSIERGGVTGVAFIKRDGLDSVLTGLGLIKLPPFYSPSLFHSHCLSIQACAERVRET